MADESRASTGEVRIDELLDDRHLLDTLLEYSPDHIYFKDRKSRFVRVSRSLAEWMGLSDPVDAIGDRTTNSLPPPTRGKRERTRPRSWAADAR